MDLQQPAANLSELCRSCEHPLGKAGVVALGAGGGKESGAGSCLYRVTDLSATELHLLKNKDTF